MALEEESSAWKGWWAVEALERGLKRQVWGHHSGIIDTPITSQKYPVYASSYLGLPGLTSFSYSPGSSAPQLKRMGSEKLRKLPDVTQPGVVGLRPLIPVFLRR